MVIIIDYFEATLFQTKYAKIDTNYHRLLYDNNTTISTIHSRPWGSLKTDNYGAHKGTLSVVIFLFRLYEICTKYYFVCTKYYFVCTK